MNQHSAYVQFPPILAKTPAASEQLSTDGGDEIRSEIMADDHLPPEQRTVVNDATQVIHACMKSMTENIFEVGRQLVRVKAILAHGKFRTWLKEFGLNERLAQHWMNVYQRLGQKAELFHTLKLTALYRLSMPSTPESVIAIVEQMILKGHQPLATEVEALVKARKRSAQRRDEIHGTRSEPLAEALQEALTALSIRTILHCERLLGESAAQRLSEVQMELEWLLEQAESFGTFSAKSTVVSESTAVLPIQSLDAQNAKDRRPDVETVQVLDADRFVTDRIIPGCTVFVREVDTGREAYYTLVENEMGQPEVGRISWKSPVAKALRNKRVGEITTADTPDGAIRLMITGICFPDGRTADSQDVI